MPFLFYSFFKCVSQLCEVTSGFVLLSVFHISEKFDQVCVAFYDVFLLVIVLFPSGYYLLIVFQFMYTVQFLLVSEK